MKKSLWLTTKVFVWNELILLEKVIDNVDNPPDINICLVVLEKQRTSISLYTLLDLYRISQVVYHILF